MGQPQATFDEILERAAHLGDPTGLRSLLLENVEGISSTEEAVAVTQNLEWIAQCNDIVHLRMALFISLLFSQDRWQPDDLRLIYADLSLFDHGRTLKNLELVWVVGHRLGKAVGWPDLYDRYLKHIAKSGTSVLNRDYLLGLLPSVYREAVSISNAAFGEVSILEPEVKSIGEVKSAEGIGSHASYFANVIFKGNIGDGPRTPVSLYHFQAGVEDHPRKLERSACSAHLYLTFVAKSPLSPPVQELTDAAKQLIQAQLQRIAALYLLEKASGLRKRAESITNFEKARNNRLLTDVGTLIDGLQKVQANVRVLQHSLESPLEKFTHWTNALLPPLFSTDSRPMSDLDEYFPEIPTEHNERAWTADHLVVALWWLCAPPRKGDRLTPALWDTIAKESAEAFPGDPLTFCAARALVTDANQVKALAGAFKRLQQSRAEAHRALYLDRHVVQFLLGVRLDADALEGSILVDSNWQAGLFVGLPRLAQLLGKSVCHNLTASVGIPDAKSKTVIRVTWETAYAGTALQTSVKRRLNALCEKAKKSPSKTASELLEDYEGINDTTTAIVRVMLRDRDVASLETRPFGEGASVAVAGNAAIPPLASFRFDGKRGMLIVRPMVV